MKSSDEATAKMGLVGATGVGVGAIVGGGILALAGVAFANTGPSAILAFALNGVVAMLTALTFAELASKFPESGGTYTFARKVLSVEAAFMVGWVVWFASIAAAVLYAIGFAFFLMIMIEQIWQSIAGSSPSWLTHPSMLTWVAIGTTLLTSIGLMVQRSSGGNWVNIGKVLVFAILIACGFFALARQPVSETSASLQPFFQNGFVGLIQAMGYTFIALQGFDLIAAVGGEVRTPRKTLPRAIVLSLLIALAIYLPLLFVIASVGTPAGQTIASAAAENPEGIVAIAATEYLGGFGYWLVIVAAVLSMYSALQANLFAASRIALAMAADRTLPAALARLSKQTQAPSAAIVATAVLVILILLVLPDVSAAGAAASLIFLITFSLTHWLAYLTRRRSRNPFPFRVPLFPLVPLLGGLACLSLAVFQGIVVPMAGLVAVAWLGLGGVLFVALFRRRARVVDAASAALNPELIRLRGRSPLVLVPVANPHNVAAMMTLADALVPADIGRVLMQTVAVIPPAWNPEEDLTAVENSQQVLHAAITSSARTGIRVETLTTACQEPMQEIARVAQLHRCDSVLLGLSKISDNSSGQRMESLLGTLDANVIILRAGNAWQLDDVQTILVPIGGGGSHDSLRAQLLGSLLRSSKRELTYLRIMPQSASPAEMRQAERELQRLADDEVRVPCAVLVMQSEQPIEAVIERTAQSDLVILGAQRHDRRKKIFGDFTRRLAGETTSPLIIISRRG